MDEPTRTIPLTRGMVALIDAADYAAVVAVGSWHAVPAGGSTFYAMRGFPNGNGRKWKKVGLHAFLTGWPRTDHINGDGLDNRRSNLRVADHAENMRNVGLRSDNRSGFKGVSWAPKSDKFLASIKVDGRSMNLGYYDMAEEAAMAYDIAASEHFGEFARLNFPLHSLGGDYIGRSD